MTQMDNSKLPTDPFTERERAILRLMADGLSNQEIADRLFLALTTVKWYIRRINDKLDTHRRTQTLIRARQFNLISDDQHAPQLTLGSTQSRNQSNNKSQNFAEVAAAASSEHMLSAANILPVPAVPFVGRAEELSRIASLLIDPDCRLLTLLGLGGVGKTRLALQAATDQIPLYPEGVYFIALQSVATSDLIPSAVATALNIQFYDAEEPRIKIIKWLKEKRILLVMDNFEHLLAGTDLLTEILVAAPEVKILVSSRERLNVQEEWALELGGLLFPTDVVLHQIEAFDSVQLFVTRARQIHSEFSLEENAPAIRTICQQVEGMPLAIELAVSWLRVMTCQQIAIQIANNLAFLTSPLRNLPERHRSMQIAFEQSWDLLSLSEQDVLMRLSIFRGGFDLEAGNAVAGASPTVLANLADKSLIRVHTSGRYDSHELLRQFTAAKLTEQGETDIVARRHLEYFMHLAEEMEADIFSPRQTEWLNTMLVENDNLRAALAYSLQAGEAESGLRLAGALGWFWHILCYWNEGCDWLEKLLISENVSPSIRAKALHHVGDMAGLAGNDAFSQMRLQQALDLARTTRDKWNIAWALSTQGYFSFQENHELMTEALTLFRELNDNWGIYHALIRFGMGQNNNLDQLIAFYSEALSLAHSVNANVNIAWAQLFVAVGDYLKGNTNQTNFLLEDTLKRFRSVNDQMGIYLVLIWIGIVSENEGDFIRAEAAFNEAIDIGYKLGNVLINSFCLGLSGPLLRWKLKSPEWATRILSATETFFANAFWLFRIARERHITELDSELGDAAFSKAWAEGKVLTVEQAVAYGFGEMPLPVNLLQPSNPPPFVEPLTDRELDVLRLMGQGLSNPKIAEQLIVAIGTVKAHTNSIFSKLNVNNRVQAVNRAKELRLL